MSPTHTAVYAAISMLILFLLGVHVSLMRLRKNVFFGDGEILALRRASRAHAVSVQHLMPLLLLLLILELLGAGKPVIDGLGIAIVGSRLVHIGGFLAGHRLIQMTGATLTYATELIAIVVVLTRVSGLA